MDDNVFIIAEAGVNHNGSKDTAVKMADAARDAGADAIKFQTFKAEALVTGSAQKAEYQKTAHGKTQFEMLKELELSYSDYEEINEYCVSCGIMFLSTPFDDESIDFLNGLGMPIFKIPSGEITNYPHLKKIAKLNKRVILSTGMSSLFEVESAYKTLLDFGATQVDLLHCTSLYPAPYDSVNLRAMDVMREKFGCVVGYSDHTLGIEIALAAAARGAKIIEKHFTLDKMMDGPDHAASIEPNELKSMVTGIRHISEGLGKAQKECLGAELNNRDIVRKSIVAKRDITRGEIFSEDNLAVKRPGGGLPPDKWDEITGKTAERDYARDEMI